MPTGYTDQITDEMTLKEFSFACARAFGALILMRDEPLDTPIPEKFEPSDYHAKALAEARATIARMETASVIVLQAEIDQHNESAKKHIADSLERSDDLRKKYERMLAMVREWQPPSSEHDALKTFMESQITESIKWDCHDEQWLIDCYKPFSGTPEEWRRHQLNKAMRDVDYHTKEHREEEQRTASRNRWIKLLRECF